MKSGHQSGYTIVEAMIFIAVSGSLFFTAMTAIGGRQQEVQFTQAVRGFDSQLKDIMNDISTGYFPSFGSVKCTISALSASDRRPELRNLSSGESGEQGTSNDCIFVGKALQFAPDTGEGAENDKILVYTLVGRRLVAQGTTKIETKNIAEANPVAVAPGTHSSTRADLEDFTERITLDWGLQVQKIVAPGLSGVNDTSMALALFNTFTDTQAESPVSSSQVVDLAVLPKIEAGFNSFDAVNELNKISGQGDTDGGTELTLNPEQGIILCLSGPDEDRKAAITLSSENRRLSTSVTFDQVPASCN